MKEIITYIIELFEADIIRNNFILSKTKDRTEFQHAFLAPLLAQKLWFD